MQPQLLKSIALFLVFNLLFEIFFPTIAYALTGGPSQPEMESFEPVGTTDMVDLFSGDFNYNIPLIDVGGYPINIAYHSGISMDQEASWVGLGWNINAGVINRVLRGLPDDFKNDQITYETNMRENISWSLTGNIGDIELFGKKVINPAQYSGNYVDDTISTNTSLDINLGVTQNNYRGLGVFFGVGVSVARGHSMGPQGSNTRIGIGAGSQTGFDYDVSYTKKTKNEKNLNIGVGINSRSGLKDITLSVTRKKTYGKEAREKLSKSRRLFNFLFSLPTIFMNPVAELPTLDNSYETRIQNYNVTLGSSVFGAHPSFRLGGTSSITTIKDRVQKRGGYGHMYAQFATGDLDAIQDFTREKDGGVSASTKYLPLSSATYDMLNVSGQGTGGVFRTKRNNLGVFFNPNQEQKSSNLATLGAEVGIATVGAVTSLHFGADYNPSISDEQSGVWEEGNDLLGEWYGDHSDKLYEPYIFKAGGEMVPMNQEYYNALGGDEAAMLDIDGRGLLYRADAKTILESSSSANSDVGNLEALSSINAQQKRQPRVQHVSAITAGEANVGYGTMPSLKSYYPNVPSTQSNAYRSINRLSTGNAKSHHMGEITQVNPDGTRYVYGIPAYNNEQHDVSFNTGGNSIDYNKGLVGYNPGNDNTLGNQKGQSWFFNRVVTPSYAHSFLLTAVLSPNYVDADRDGKPSINDIGDYVVFNYTRHDSAYKWRVPVESNKAQFQEGLKSDPLDDKGNYVYGTKEIWYLHSIETRTHVAEFKLSPRADGLGALGENGGKDDDRVLLKLDTIKLFARPDHIINGALATPIKQVVFEYDYSLCKHIPNNKFYQTDAGTNKKGKLTLKKLYFLYGKSGKGSMSPYTFAYGYNPDYNMAEYDRWGNYKPNNESLPNRDFPYVSQNNARDSSDKYHSAWHMEQINLPSGGTIQITYEADDYAFVQDQKAMEMIQIVGVDDASCKTSYDINATHNMLYGDKGKDRFEYLIFKLPDGIVSASELKYKCFNTIEQLFFKFLINIKGKKEYISGWCTIDKNEIGIVAGDLGYGYVKINSLEQGDRLLNKKAKVNAISKIAWQFASVNMSKVLRPGSEPAGTGVSAFKGLWQSMGEALDMYRGQYQALKTDGVASTFEPYKSWIRIESASMRKRGGGSRVKELSFSDSWSSMDPNDKTTGYTQVYDYTIKDESYSQYGYTNISSGVACYEPMIGGEENPLRIPVKYIKEQKTGLPALELYNEEPFGETFYPAPQVGYSKVTVYKKPKTGIERTGVGHSEYEFYTAKDFPVRVDVTELHSEQLGAGKAGNMLSSLLRKVKLSYYSASQGYSVIINDMHGKPKATATYGQPDNISGIKPLISKVSYTYQTKDGKLDNTVNVLNNQGKIETAVIGKEIDISVDMGQNQLREINSGLEVNAKLDIAVPLPPLAWAIPVGSFQYQQNRLQWASVTKVIQEYGVLQSTTVQDEGSMIKTSNLLYDKVTGSVLLTQTANAFNDPIYDLKYLAHMAYEGMGPAYENAGLVDSIYTSGGLAYVSHNNFVRGDVLMLDDMFSDTYTKVWVESTEALNDSITTVHIINEYGPYHAPTGAYWAKVIESGKKNRLTEGVGGITTTALPIVGDSIRLNSGSIISASANTFKDVWPARHVPKASNLENQICDYVLLPHFQEMMQVMLNMIKLNRENEEEESDFNPYPIQDKPWFNEEESYIYQYLQQRIEFGDETQVYVGVNAGWALPYVEPFIENWADSLSVAVSVYVIEGEDTTVLYGADFGGSYNEITNQACFLNNIDTFISFTENNLFNPYNGGLLTFINTAGDTCRLKFLTSGEGGSGLGDVETLYPVNCRTIYDCNYHLPLTDNPFLVSRYGQWRPYEHLAFIDDRQYHYNTDTTFIRKDGVYKTFIPYWNFNHSGILQGTPHKQWVKSSTLTQYNLSGKPSEAVDALGNSSAELYGYDGNYVIASAANARLKDIANDNFEDYSTIEEDCFKEDHWNYKSSYTNWVESVRSMDLSDTQNPDTSNTFPFLSKNFVHSGTQSMGLPAGSLLTTSSMVDSIAVYKLGVSSLMEHISDTFVSNRLPRFNPSAGKQYKFEAWVRSRATSINSVNTYENDSCAILIETRTEVTDYPLMQLHLKPSGPIIEGWQRIEGSFIPSAGSAYITITLENKSTHRVYFDDIRIYPIEASMKTYVYHPLLLKPMAILDENNFATFFEYDQEGKLIRKKKETTKGIVTLQESRSGINKTLNQ